MANSKMGKMSGSTKSSYQSTNENKTRLILRHTKSVNEESRGSRSRNIKDIFIEDSFGQRFLYPNTHLPGARAMAKHIARGGTMQDSMGTYITGLSEEHINLMAFNKEARKSLLEDDDQHIILSVKDRCRTINRILTSLKSFKGHTAYSQNLPVTEEYDEEILNTTASELASRCGHCDTIPNHFYTAAKIKLSIRPVMQEDSTALQMESVYESWIDDVINAPLIESFAGTIEQYVSSNLDKPLDELKREAYKMHGQAGADEASKIYHTLMTTGTGQ